MASVTIVVCGAPLAVRAQRLDSCLRGHDWEAEWIATPSALPWLAGQPLVEAVRSTYMPVDERRVTAERSALIVFPATFNTIGKLANGIADTYAHSVMCESLGLGLPFVVVPMANAGLRAHPAWAKNVCQLMAAGAVFMDPGTGRRCAHPDDIVEAADLVSVFDEGSLVAMLDTLAPGRKE